MAAEVFSSSLATFSGDLENPSLQGTLNFLKNVLLDDFKLLVWSDWQLAVPIAIDVELPSLGNFDGLDIRPKEPVLLVFDKQNYPTKAPTVYSDRLDFPKDRLAHLYIAKNGRPPAFCYVRDPDHLSPHNLVRHSSGGEYVGSNKAFALGEVIRKLYPTEELPLLSGPSYKEGRFEKKETFDKCRWIFDFTASDAFFNKLVLAESFKTARIFSASISDFGNLGILLKEGKNRNPRIDDLQAYLYSCSMSDEKISSWLKREREAKANNNLVVQVGVGCNSETTILSDEKISAHGAFVTAILKREMADSIDSQAKIKLHRITEDSDYQVETDSIEVKPFDVLTAVNDSSWTIRFKDGLLDKIEKAAAKKRNKETGGSFLGAVNYKTKVIHVTDLIDAPDDSEGNAICFYRGHSGLSQKISMVTDKSGGQIGYVGEWHSHPQGPNCLSDVDMASVNRFKKELSELVTPLPVFLTVVAPVGILSYVF